jgi:hypothetical protein
VVSLIVIGEQGSDNPEQEYSATREALLAPLYEQIDVVRARRSRGDESGDNKAPGNNTDSDDVDGGRDDDMGGAAGVHAAAGQQ